MFLSLDLYNEHKIAIKKIFKCKLMKEKGAPLPGRKQTEGRVCGVCVNLLTPGIGTWSQIFN